MVNISSRHHWRVSVLLNEKEKEINKKKEIVESSHIIYPLCID